jgi:hypothetical protein
MKSAKRNPKSKLKGSGQPGVSVRPGDLPAPDEPADEQQCAGPMGIPISREEYEKLQHESRHRALPRTSQSQEDAADTDDG